MSKLIPPPPPKPRTKRARNDHTPMSIGRGRVNNRKPTGPDALHEAGEFYEALDNMQVYPSGVTAPGGAPLLPSSNMGAVQGAVGMLSAERAAALLKSKERKAEWVGRTSKDPAVGPTARMTDHHARSIFDR